MDPNTLVAQGNAEAEQREQSILGQGTQGPVFGQPSTGSTTDQALSALNTSNKQSTTPTPTAPTNQPNLLERLLPTIGGIGGGILGNLLAPVAGGIGGAAGGSAFGKFLEDKLTGQAGGNGVLGAAAGGALGEGIGAGAGAFLGKAGGLLAGTAEKMTANGAAKATQASADAATQATEAASQKAYGAIPKGLRQAHDLEGSLGFSKQLGLDTTNHQGLVDAGNSGKEILTNAANDALGQAGPVDASSYGQMVKDAIASRSGTLGGFDPVAMSRGRLGPSNSPASKLLSQLQDYGAGVAKTNADPGEVRSLLQQVGSAYGDATPTVTALTGAKDPVQVATHGVLGDVYNNLKNVLYNRPEVAENFNSLPANIRAEDVGGNQAIADHLNEVIGSGQGHQPVLDALQKYGNLANSGHDAVTAAKGIVPDIESAAAVPKSNPFNADNAVKLGSLLEGTVGNHPLALAAPLVMKAAENPAVIGGIGKGVSKLGGSAIPGILGSVVGNSPNDVAGPADAGSSISLNQGGDMNSGNSILDDQVLAALAQYGNGGASQLGGATQMLQKSNEAQAAEQNLASNFNQAGGAQGPIGGILSRLGSVFTGGEAGQYGGQAQADAEAIAQATGVPVQQIEKSIPSLGENQSAAQASLGNMQSLIQALTQGTQGSGIVAGAYK